MFGSITHCHHRIPLEKYWNLDRCRVDDLTGSLDLESVLEDMESNISYLEDAPEGQLLVQYDRIARLGERLQIIRKMV